MITDSRSLTSSTLRETLLGGLVLGGILMLVSKQTCLPDTADAFLCVDPETVIILGQMNSGDLWLFGVFLFLSYMIGTSLTTVGDVFVPDREPMERTRERIETIGLSGNALLIDEWKNVRRFQNDLRSGLGAGFVLLTVGILHLASLLVDIIATGSAQWITTSANPFSLEVAKLLGGFALFVSGSALGAFFFMSRAVKPWATNLYERRLQRLDALGGLKVPQTIVE